MGTAKTILIVDDDKSTREVLNAILTKAGFKVILEADVLELHPFKIVPDIILLDNNLPDIQGDSFCAQLKNNPDTKNIPVILISAMEGLKEKAHLACADDYINKPFGISLLLGKINALLQKPHEATR